MKLTRFVLALCACTLVAYCHAGIALGATRVILDEGRHDATISVKNTGTDPFLTQSWIQKDESDADTPATELWVTPPVLRLAGDKEAVLHIMPLDVTHLSKDTESLFFLNVQQVPQMDNANDTNRLVLAIRQRIKVFYRPKGLQGSVVDAPNQLEIAFEGNDSGVSLKLTNPSAYHLSFVNLVATSNGKPVLESGPFVLAPHSARSLPLNNARQADKLSFHLVDDFGASNGYERTLTTPSPAH